MLTWFRRNPKTWGRSWGCTLQMGKQLKVAIVLLGSAIQTEERCYITLIRFLLDKDQGEGRKEDHQAHEQQGAEDRIVS